MAGTIVQLGLTNVLTDVFGAHPLLGGPLNLNDGVTFTLTYPDGLEMAPPPHTVGLSGNVRTQGERAVRAVYRTSREVRLGLIVGPAASYAALVATVRQLLLWVNAAPQSPITIQWQAPNAAMPVYLDVLAAASDIPADEGDWLRLQFEPIELIFICRPGLRGDRVTLQNLVVNPGFGAPSGPGVQVFTDPFATLNTYTVSGSAPTFTPANGYPDIVGADAPLRYYRLDEASGTVANDVSGQGSNGAYVATPTLGVAGAISGDSDTAITLNGTSQYMQATSPTGLPMGSAPWTIEAWVKIAANPSALAVVASMANWGGSSGAYIGVTSAGKAEAGIVGTVIDSSAALSTGAWHHLVATFGGGAGGTLTLYVDGASAGTTTLTPTLAYTSVGVFVGCGAGPIHELPGSVDEAAFYGVALSSTRVSAHYSAGHSGVTGTVANAISIPASTTLAFGSPAWGAFNTWQVRFRWQPTAILELIYAYADANDTVFVQIIGTGLRIFQRIAGTATLLASTAITLTPGVWYWAQVTQFPSPPGDAVSSQVELLADAAGAPGAQLALTGPIGATSAANVAALLRIEASTAPIVIGGAFPNVHTVALFGPGGWQFNANYNGATAQASGAWEQALANTYPSGPVVSIGASRIDYPPVGTCTAYWHVGAAGSTPTTPGVIPVAAPGDTLGYSVWARSVGLSSTGHIFVQFIEYDVNGTQLRSAALNVTLGNLTAWTQLAGSYATGASCAWVDLQLISYDLTAGASANATVWFDNAQVWDETSTRQTSMPYCELRFPQSPAQLVVSGLLGDLPAPSLLSFGALLASWPAASTLTYAIGRMAQPTATARLVGGSNGWYDSTRPPPLSTPVLDPGSWGGYFISAAIGAGWNPRAFSFHASDQPGVYHLLGRFLSQQSVGNLGNVSVRAEMQTRLNPWYGLANFTDQIAAYNGAYVYPLVASNTWTVCDSGQVAIPAFNLGGMSDPSQNWLTPLTQWLDQTGGGSTGQSNWQLLLPVDGSLVMGVINNPSNAVFGLTAQWLWAYVDGLLTNRAAAADGPAWTYSVEAGAQPNPGHGGGGPGTQTTGSININSGADPYLTLDPTSAVNNAGVVNPGVNVLAAYVADGAGDVLPFYGEMTYSPLYLYPR